MTASKEKKSASDESSQSLDELNNLIKGKIKKPKTVVPDEIRTDELPYVSQLYRAYGKTRNVDVKDRADLVALDYKEHFNQQRKTYYMAETIHHEIRDSIRPDEEDCFDVLKDEIEQGIYQTSRRPYADPVSKVDAVMERAGIVPISQNMVAITYNWRAELQPSVNRLRKDFLEYSAALEHAKAAELVDTFNRILNEQLEVINSENQEEENNSRFNIRAKINEFLKEPFNRHLAQALSECKYENLTGSRFDENICDVVVGGSEKMSQGKGFRAFLNTVLALVVQETLNEYNMFQPHLLVFDSPILSLKEREETTGTEVTTDGMRSGLFKYMISHEQNRQTIILENEIPKIDYSGVHLIHFTKKEGDELYGLIKGCRD